MDVSLLLCGGDSHTVVVDENNNIFCAGLNGRRQFGTSVMNNRVVHQLPFEVKQVVAGQSHTLFLDADGKIWGCGSNLFGQLGIGEGPEDNNLTPIENLPKIKSIASKYNHSLALDCSGEVWVFGQNSSGQLGIGNDSNSYLPVKLANLPPMQAISCGKEFSLFLDGDGDVWRCGHNSIKSRNRNATELLVPEKLEGVPKIQQISGGMTHSALLDCEGIVWHIDKQITRVAHEALPPITFIASGKNSYLLDIRKCVWRIVGSPRILPEKMNDLPPIIALAAATDSYHMVDEGGDVWSCGNNSSHQLEYAHNKAIAKPEKSLKVKMRKPEVPIKSARKV